MTDTPDDRRTVRACQRANLGVGLICTIAGSVLPAMREEYGLSYSFAGALSSVLMFFSMIALAAICVMPRFLGEKRSTILSDLSMGIGMVLLVLTGNPVVLVLAFAFQGFGKAGLSIMNNITARCSENVSKGMNTLHAVGAVGSALAPLVSMLLGPRYWKISALLVAAWCFYTSVAFTRAPLSTEKGKKGEAMKIGMPKGADYWLTVFVLFFYIAFESTTMNFLIVFMMERGIFPESVSMIMQTLLWTAIIIGRFSCSWLSEKMKKSNILIMLSSLMLIFFTVLMNTESRTMTVIAVFGLGLGMSGMFPTGISSVERKYAEDTFASNIILETATLGGLIMPMLVGRIADGNGGMTAGFRALIPCVMLLLVVIIMKKINEVRKAKKA